LVGDGLLLIPAAKLARVVPFGNIFPTSIGVGEGLLLAATAVATRAGEGLLLAATAVATRAGEGLLRTALVRTGFLRGGEATALATGDGLLLFNISNIFIYIKLKK
jgi:hypothetical protein